MGQALKYLEVLHGDNHAQSRFISKLQLGVLAGKAISNQYHYTYPELLQEIEQYEGAKDIYVSVNTFYIPQRKSSNVRHFRALYVDLDVVKQTNMTVDEAYNELMKRADEGIIPIPTIVNNSGNGLHVYWCIDDVPKKLMPVWQQMQDELFKKLNDLGADPQATDVSRVLRVPGTVNSKNNVVCTTLYINEKARYSLFKLNDLYLHPQIKKPLRTVKKGEKQADKTNFNAYTLNLARIEDLNTLIQLRDYNLTGYRNTIFHLYVNWYCLFNRDYEQILDNCLAVNAQFRESMSEKEVAGYVKRGLSAVERMISQGQMPLAYKYKNSTLIEKLAITEEEQKHMKTIISEQVKRERYNAKRRTEEFKTARNEQLKSSRRNEQGLTSREQQKQELMKQVKELKSQGLKYKEIAAQLNISVDTVKYYNRKKCN